MSILILRYIRYGCVVSFLSLFFATQANAVWQKDKVYTITLLHTNDHHGHFWQSKHGEYGLAAQKIVVDQVRTEVNKAGGSLLVLSGGDVNTGVPESDMLNAEPDFLGMDAIGYDAMAVGNHEFDNPLSVIRQQERWAKFPFLSANIYDAKTGRRLFKPYQLFNKQGLSIAVIGLTTDDTKRLGSKKILAGIEFRDPVVETKSLLKKIRAKNKPDIIIAATHMGHYEDGNHGSNAPGDVELARSLDLGSLNIIVGGHSQNPVCMESVNQRQASYVPGTPCIPDIQNGVWIVQAHEWGKYVGRADFTFINGNLTLRKYQLIPINLKKKIVAEDGKAQYVNYGDTIEQDAKLVTLLEPYQKKGAEKLDEIIGRSDVYLEGERSVVRSQQTNLGKLIITAQMAATHADLGLISSGSVRASIDAGPISYRDVLTVQPFGNTVGYVEMRGGELITYLQAVVNKKAGSGAYPQLANVTFTLDDNKITHVIIGGRVLEANKKYRISMPSYNASGGDGYPNVQGEFINTGLLDAEVLKKQVEQLGIVSMK